MSFVSEHVLIIFNFCFGNMPIVELVVLAALIFECELRISSYGSFEKTIFKIESSQPSDNACIGKKSVTKNLRQSF